jgi:putative MATE family efflux protein
MQGETHRLATDYLKILAYFNVCFAYVAISSAALRAAGDAITPVIIGVAGNVLAVFFTYGLLFGKFGLPDLGLMGAAYAVGLSMLFVGVVIHFLWLAKKLLLVPQQQTFISKARVRHLLSLSVPSVLEQLIFNGALLGFVIVISLYSEAAFTAYGIGINILSLSMLIGFGFSMATSTLVGQYLGANQPDEAEKAAWHSLRWAMGFMICIALALSVSARAIGGVVISDAQTIDYLVALVFIMAAVQPLMAVEFALSGALRGAGDTKTTAAITSAGFFLGRVLFTALFYFSNLSVYWIYGALIADYVIKAGLYLIAFKKGRWKTAFAESKRRAQGLNSAEVILEPAT